MPLKKLVESAFCTLSKNFLLAKERASTPDDTEDTDGPRVTWPSKVRLIYLASRAEDSWGGNDGHYTSAA